MDNKTLEYLIVIMITNIIWIMFLINFREIILKICMISLNDDIVYIKKSELNTLKLGLYSNKKIERNTEIIKYLNRGNQITYFGDFINESEDKIIGNCYLRKKKDGYYLISNREINNNEELIIMLN